MAIQHVGGFPNVRALRADPAVRARIGLIGLLLLLTAVLAVVCVRATGGDFAYALDDPYIHLSIARNLAQHGVWGMTPFAPSAASSSPLWTILLGATALVTGAQLLLPLVVNLIFAGFTTWRVHTLLTDRGFSLRAAFGWSFLIAAAAPFATLAFIGMEHSTQIFLVVLWVTALLEAFDAPRAAKPHLVALFVIGFGVMLVRFESAFLFVVPFFISLGRRDFRLAAVISGAPILAMAAFMTYCHAVGMPLVPNSIVLKGNVPHGEGILGFLDSIRRTLDFNLHTRNGYVVTPLLVCAVLSLFLIQGSENRGLRAVLATLIGACLLHCSFAYIGNFYRYEAYLVVSLSVAVVLAIPRIPAKPIEGLARAMTILTVFVLGYRTLASMVETPRASRDIDHQQIQMAQFIHRYYDTSPVALNDIGAVCYFSKVHLLDLWGLASDDVRALKQKGQLTRATMTPIVNRFHPDVTVVYPIWFTGGQELPSNMVPVADWQLPSVTTPAFNIVEFYAFDATGADRLRRNLEEYSASLPADVKVRFVTDRWPHLSTQ